MRNMLAFLAALTLTLAGVGWYLDWYRVRSAPTPSGQRSVTVDINTQKISKDLLEAEKKIQKKLEDKAKAEQGAGTPKLDRPVEVPPANVGVLVEE
jgi:hypothetical protein